jgi:hypothetical protein
MTPAFVDIHSHVLYGLDDDRDAPGTWGRCSALGGELLEFDLPSVLPKKRRWYQVW